MSDVRINRTGFNSGFVAKLSQEDFINRFKPVIWQQYPESERVKMLKQAYELCKKHNELPKTFPQAAQNRKSRKEES